MYWRPVGVMVQRWQFNMHWTHPVSLQQLSIHHQILIHLISRLYLSCVTGTAFINDLHNVYKNNLIFENGVIVSFFKTSTAWDPKCSAEIGLGFLQHIRWLVWLNDEIFFHFFFNIHSLTMLKWKSMFWYSYIKTLLVVFKYGYRISSLKGNSTVDCNEKSFIFLSTHHRKKKQFLM